MRMRAYVQAHCIHKISVFKKANARNDFVVIITRIFIDLTTKRNETVRLIWTEVI